MKISSAKVNALKLFWVSLSACLVAVSFTACKSESADNGSSLIPSVAPSSSTVSIYYKDDATSKIVYDDIIVDDLETQLNTSSESNLVEHAKPQLIIPSNKSENGSISSEADSVSSGDVSHRGEQIVVSSEFSGTTSLSSASNTLVASQNNVSASESKTSEDNVSHSVSDAYSESGTNDTPTASSNNSAVDSKPSISQGEANHSGPSASEDNSQSSSLNNASLDQSSEAISTVNSEEGASKDESSSATSSYDKGYTKPY